MEGEQRETQPGVRDGRGGRFLWMGPVPADTGSEDGAQNARRASSVRLG